MRKQIIYRKIFKDKYIIKKYFYTFYMYFINEIYIQGVKLDCTIIYISSEKKKKGEIKIL